MAGPHSTENALQDSQFTVLELVATHQDLKLYAPCLIQIQHRRDGKGYRLVRKPLHTVPLPVGEE